jgi:ATP-dependent DNA helicase RecG
MILEEFRALATEGESERLEFKRSTAEVERALRTACGMLNCGIVGYVVFGVANSGHISGQPVGDNTLEGIAQRLQTAFEPPPPIGIDRVPIEGNNEAIVLRIGPGWGLYSYDGHPYERVGRTTHRMPKSTYERRLLEQAHSGNRWELLPAEGLTFDDLDASEIVRTVEEAIRRQRLDDPGTRDVRELLVGLGVMDGDRILNAAVVLFGKPSRLQMHYPQCVLRMARFRGVTTAEFVDNRQEIGNLFELFVRGQRFLRDHLPVAGRIVPDLFERVDDPLYPPEALREALANALCHRDYRAGGGSVSLAIFDDRLEVTSTGPLPFGLTSEDLARPHQSRPWNPLIAGALFRRGIIETWGRGTLKMVELAQAAGLPAPEFEATRHHVTVRFRAGGYVAPTRVGHDLSAVQQRILTVLVASGPASLGQIRQSLGGDIPERTLQDNPQMLKGLGLVDLSGTRRAARWSLRTPGSVEQLDGSE